MIRGKGEEGAKDAVSEDRAETAGGFVSSRSYHIGENRWLLSGGASVLFKYRFAYTRPCSSISLILIH